MSLDTVRADRLGCYGYAAAQTPQIDALAASGLRFEQATTVAPLTLPAHASLMTGTFPGWHGVRDNGGFYLDDDQLTLAEILRDKGFRTGGFVGSFVLDRRWGIAQGFHRYFDDFDLDRFPSAAAMDMIQRPGSAGRRPGARVAAVRSRTSRSLPGSTCTTPTRRTKRRNRSGRDYPRTNDGAYDAEIASADAQVGRLLGALRSDGRLDDTLVVVAADHGEMLGEHGELTHGFFIYEAATHIPLIVSGPGVPAAVVSEQVRIVDVMPTALSLLGIPVPKQVQGTDLMPLVPRPAPRPRRAQRKLVSQVSLRLERAARHSRRPLQVHPRATSRVVRPRDRSGARNATDRRSPHRGSTCSAARSRSSSPAPRERARRGARGQSMRKRKNAWPRWDMWPAAST